MASYQPVTAVLRGLGVLAATSRLDGRATLAEIHRLTGLDKSTILRMLETLEHAGFIVRNDERRSYQVTGGRHHRRPRPDRLPHGRRLAVGCRAVRSRLDAGGGDFT
jgi:hypothetical protein